MQMIRNERVLHFYSVMTAEWLRQVAEQHNKQMHCDNGNIDHVGSVKDEHNTIMNTDTIDYVLRDLNLDGQDLSMLYTRFNFLCP